MQDWPIADLVPRIPGPDAERTTGRYLRLRKESQRPQAHTLETHGVRFVQHFLRSSSEAPR